MGGICSKSDVQTTDLPRASVTVKAEKERKWVEHDGDAFADESQAEHAAEAWIALPENEGWKYSLNHRLVHEGEKSEFEVTRTVKEGG